MDRKVFRDILLLFGIIIIAAVGARMLAGGETLTDYAEKNPEALESSSQQNDTNDSIFQATGGKTVTSNNVDDSTQKTTAAAADNGSTTDVSDIGAASDTVSPDRVTFAEGFYYEPISNDVFKRISGISYPVDCTVSLDELRYMVVRYVDFEGKTKSGELICNKALAQDLVEIFSELYNNDYRIESIKLVDEFGGDDTASMLANNTSCFNYRVVPGTTHISNHAKGRAIDINPFYNPYITYNKDGTANISPEGSEPYADRTASFPYKIDENDLAYKLFKEHGFTWGGNWNSVKDYQHFEKK